MTLPNNLCDLQKLCEEKSLKFKGKTKAQLKELLSMEVITIEDEVFAGEDLSKLTVKALKERCENEGLSKCGTKGELLKRLETKNTMGLQVVKWKKKRTKSCRDCPGRFSE